jgi:KDO2-lipid IV(A) lauroyltransferase
MTESELNSPRPPGSAIDHAPGVAASPLRRISADFWREFLFFWTEHAPRVVLWTRPFFLWFTWHCSRGLRRVTLANAKRILPNGTDEQRRALARAVVEHAYLCVYELGMAARMTRPELRACIDGVEGIEHYLAARRLERGAIIATAHVGPFEIGATALLDQESNVHVVFRRDEFPRFDRLRSRLRSNLGIIEAPIDQGWSIWMGLRDALRRNEVVMIQADRVMPGQKGVPVPFLGGRMMMPLGPIKLALATGAPIVPIFSHRTAIGRLRVTIERPIVVSRDNGPIVGACREPAALRELAAAVERHVRAHPDQWFMLQTALCEDQHDGCHAHQKHPPH